MRIVYYLFILYLILFPLGQLNRLPVTLLGPEVHFYLTDILVAVIAGAWFLWRLSQRKKTKPPIFWPIFFFIFFSGLSLVLKAPLLENREVAVAGLYFLRWVVYSGLYFALFDLKKMFKTLCWPSIQKYLLGAGALTAVFGWIQYFLWPDLRLLEVLSWDPHYYRIVGSFLDPGYLGLIFTLTLILLVVNWKKKEPLKLGGFGLALYLALALTYSRASYLAYLVGMGVIAWLKKAPKFFLLVLFSGLITILLLPRPEGEGGRLARRYSIEARIENWQNSLKVFKDHPLTGVGFNAYRYAQRDYGFLDKGKWQESHSGAGVDSSFLFVLSTTGILGFGAYLWLWIEAAKTGFKGSRGYKLVVLPSLAAVLVHSFFLNSLFYPWVMAWVWVLLAYGE